MADTTALTKTLKDGRTLVVAVGPRREAGATRDRIMAIASADAVELAAGVPERVVGGVGRWAHAPSGDLVVIVGEATVVLTAEEGAVVFAAIAVAEAAAEARLESAVPGLGALAAALAERDRYDELVERYRESRSGRYPAAPKSDPEALRAAHPRAALYLKAQAYAERAADYRKSAAGKRAMDVLAGGGADAEAAAILDGWLDGAYVD